MAKYEVWDKKDLGKHKALPKDTFFTIDNGIAAAKKLSIGTYEVDSWEPDKKDPWGFGKPAKITLPVMMALVERGDCQSVIRGYGINGVWKDVVTNCKRCGGSGTDQKNGRWQDNCPSCKGASYRPKI
jgi:hypothetical protein